MMRRMGLLAWMCWGCSQPGAVDVEATPSVASVQAAPGTAVRAADPLEPTLIEYGQAPRRYGHLYVPAGDGPFPAVIYNHGSERTPPDFRGQARFYVPRGYVLFVPLRRGHGASAVDVAYRADLLGTRQGDAKAFVDLMETQAQDVSAALEYLRVQPMVDPRRIVMAGCSLGGVQTVLAAERHPELRAAVNFAGAAIMWQRNAPLRARLIQAAQNARVPVLFVQAENDFDTTPSRVLADKMRAAGRSGRAMIFPRHGETARAGHAFCAGGRSPAWGPVVLAFINAAR
jgi:dienelactone hydrolase